MAFFLLWLLVFLLPLLESPESLRQFCSILAVFISEMNTCCFRDTNCYSSGIAAAPAAIAGDDTCHSTGCPNIESESGGGTSGSFFFVLVYNAGNYSFRLEVRSTEI